MNYQDSVIAGGPDDFMEVRHLTLRGSSKDIGYQLAKVAQESLGAEKVPWTDPLATQAQKLFLQKNWPALYQRSCGVAEHFGISIDDHSLDCSFLAYDMAIPGCSIVFYPNAITENGHSVLSRNYDFNLGDISSQFGMNQLTESLDTSLQDASHPRPINGRPFLLETYPDEGYATLLMCANELLGTAMDGINEEGLCVALAMDAETLYGEYYDPLNMNFAGLNECHIPRFLLETCATVEEAKLALLSTPQRYVNSPAHYLIGDRDGNSFVWESSLSRNRTHIIESPGEKLCVTNHLLHEHADQRVELIDESIERLDSVRGHRPAAGDKYSKADIEAANLAVAALSDIGIGQYPNATYPTRTLWYAQYDLDSRSVQIDFYLGEEGGEVRRSPALLFSLER